MSLGDGGNYTSDSFSSSALLRRNIQQKIRTLRENRVAVVIAAGNDYFSHREPPGHGLPSHHPRVRQRRRGLRRGRGRLPLWQRRSQAYSSRPGQITPFSQRLHESVSPDTYTDIFAPGAPVTSSGINGPHGESVQHGTSQATPVTAGLILLMQEFYWRATGELPTVDDLILWLRRGGVTIHDGDDEDDNVEHTNLDFLRADALSALDAVRRHLQKQRLEESRGGG